NNTRLSQYSQRQRLPAARAGAAQTTQELIMPRWIEGTVVENVHWTDALYSVRVRADVTPFTPGQFGRLGLEIDGKPVGRPYSFVNAPDDDICEFYSIVVPEGPLSPRLNALQPGDRVLVSPKGAGFFTL